MSRAISCPATFEYAGLFKTDEPWIHPTRTIDNYEILAVVTGTVRIFEGDCRYTLSPGDLMVLRPGLEHGGWQVSEGETSFYWIHFRPSDDLPPLPYAPIRLEDPSHLNLLCRQLLHLNNAPGYPPYAIEAAFQLVFSEVAHLSNQEKSGTRLVSEIAEWIRINSHRPLTVFAVAHQAGYHPDYLSVLFKDAFRMSLKQYIVQQRMQQIRSRLLTTSDSIKEIAAQLGFASENQMLHFFRYHEGISPKSYRDLYHHTHLNRM